MRRLVTVVFLTATTAAPAVQATKPQIQWDPNYDFSAVSSFEWLDTPPTSIALVDQFLHQHIINAIEFELTSKGLNEVEQGGDIRVTYHMSSNTDIRLQSSSVGYGFSDYGRPGWRNHCYGFGGPIYTDTRIVEMERGDLVVDILDVETGELVWRGEVDDIDISNDRQKTIRRVEKAIKRMVKQNDKLRRRQ